MPERNSPNEGPPSGLTPILVVSDGAAASHFYSEAFGAQEIARIASPDRERLLHCRMSISGSVLVLMDEFPEFAGKRSTFHPPNLLNGTSVTLHLQVEDAHSMWERAIAAGALAIVPLAVQFWGELYGRLRDPFRHEWTIAQMLQQLENHEVEQAAADIMQ